MYCTRKLMFQRLILIEFVVNRLSITLFGVQNTRSVFIAAF